MKLTSYWKRKLDYHTESLERLNKVSLEFPGELPKGLDRRARVKWQARFSQYTRHYRKLQKHQRLAAYCRERIDTLKNRTFWDVLNRGIGV